MNCLVKAQVSTIPCSLANEILHCANHISEWNIFMNPYRQLRGESGANQGLKSENLTKIRSTQVTSAWEASESCIFSTAFPIGKQASSSYTVSTRILHYYYGIGSCKNTPNLPQKNAPRPQDATEMVYFSPSTMNSNTRLHLLYIRPSSQRYFSRLLHKRDQTLFEVMHSALRLNAHWSVKKLIHYCESFFLHLGPRNTDSHSCKKYWHNKPSVKFKVHLKTLPRIYSNFAIARVTELFCACSSF